MRYFFTLLSAMLIALSFGCNKPDKVNQPIGNRSDMLQGSTWRLSSMKDNGSEVGASCKLNDIWIFNEGGTGSKDDGGDRCTPDDEQVSTFRWFTSGDQRILEIYQYSGTDYGVQLDTKWMDWEFTYMTPDELDIKYYAVINGVGHSYELSFSRSSH